MTTTTRTKTTSFSLSTLNVPTTATASISASASSSPPSSFSSPPPSSTSFTPPTPSSPSSASTSTRFKSERRHTRPLTSLSLSLTLKVFNRDFLSLDYSSLVVSIGYRGRVLGFVTSSGGHVRARGSSYVNATLELDGFQVIHDVFYLLEDLIKGSIPFDTNSKVTGHVGLFFLEIPIKATISCEVIANTNNQTIIRQDCYS